MCTADCNYRVFISSTDNADDTGSSTAPILAPGAPINKLVFSIQDDRATLGRKLVVIFVRMLFLLVEFQCALVGVSSHFSCPPSGPCKAELEKK